MMVRSVSVLLLMVMLPATHAEPFIAPGDLWLRHDLQVLSDAGLIQAPLSAWPVSVGDVSAALNTIAPNQLMSNQVRLSLERVHKFLRPELEVGLVNWNAEVSLSERSPQIRSFAETAKGRQEVWLSADYTGERVAANLRVGYVGEDEVDDKSLRLDGSYISLALGNWLIGASAQDRYWGPGWNSSLLLSNNARPIPAFTLQRNYSIPFKSRWLSWIGPWSTNMIWGQLENSRPVSNARLFAWRVNAKPLPSLEIGLQRSIQWCGAGRDCSTDAFLRSIVGDSNLDSGVTVDVANQLAGFDVRWASPLGNLPYAVYGQFIGEDEAGGFPSKFFGQFGVEFWGYLNSYSTSWRLFAEYSDTTCQFYESSRIFNCTYNNGSYPSGYRYRARSIGHSSDNDAQSVVLGLVARSGDRDWGLSVRSMKLNRGGAPDFSNTLTAVPQDQIDADLFYRMTLFNGAQFDARLGAVTQDRATSGSTTEVRASVALQFSLFN